MNTTLIHNPGAGARDLSESDLRDALRAAGHEVHYASTRSGKWKKALQHPGDLVVVAGGDGTVAKVARRLAFRPVPLAILPCGTANNFASSLGISGHWRDLIEALPHLDEQGVDAGLAAGPWGQRVFLEGAGLGALPHAIRRARTVDDQDDDDSPAEQLRGDLARLLAVVRALPTVDVRLEVDGRSVEGSCFLAEAMLTPFVGPGVRLTPGASWRDGMLHVVIAREQDRPLLVQYLETRLSGEQPPLPLETYPGRTASFAWSAGPLHVDDHLREGNERLSRAFFACAPDALRVLIPRSR